MDDNIIFDNMDKKISELLKQLKLSETELHIFMAGINTVMESIEDGSRYFCDWISVNKHLPQSPVPVWVTRNLSSGNCVSIDTYYMHRWVNYDDGSIIAWKSKEKIPEPYNPEKEDPCLFDSHAVHENSSKSDMDMFDWLSAHELQVPDKTVDVKDVVNITSSPICDYVVHSTYRDIFIIINMLDDYICMLSKQDNANAPLTTYYIERFQYISDSLTEQIGLDKEKMRKKCEKRSQTGDDVGEDALTQLSQKKRY